MKTWLINAECEFQIKGNTYEEAIENAEDLLNDKLLPDWITIKICEEIEDDFYD